MSKALLLLFFALFSCQFAFSQADSLNQLPQAAKTDTLSSSNEVSNVERLLGVDGQNKEEWQITFEKIFWSVIIFMVALISLRYFTRLFTRISERKVSRRLFYKSFIPLIRIIGWTVTFYIIIADVIAPPVATLLAVLASAGIAVGFAAQDILKNIFGGVIILIDKPFQVGDKVEIGNYYGEITDIGLRAVRLVTPDDSMVTIPNNEIVNTSVSNSNSGEHNCQVVAEVYLPAYINTEKAREVAIRCAAVSRYVFLKKPIVVLFINEIQQGKTILKMRLKAYVSDLKYEFAFKSEMTEIVLVEFFKHGLLSLEDLIINKKNNFT